MERIKRLFRSKVFYLLLLILVSIPIGFIAYHYWAIAPRDAIISNRTDRSLTLSWVSNKKDAGVAIAQRSDPTIPFRISKYNAEIVGHDDRDLKAAELKQAEKNSEAAKLSGGEIQSSMIETELVVDSMGKHYVHHVTFTNLEPESEYNFLAGNGVVFREVSVERGETFTAFESISVPNPAYGVILEQLVEGGVSPSSPDSIVYIQVELEGGVRSQILSSVTSENGSWYIDLSNARDVDGNQLGDISNGLREYIRVEAGPAGSISEFEGFTDFDAPMKPLVLDPKVESQSKAPFDFFASEVHAVCCNPGVCNNDFSFGGDENYGGPNCDHRNNAACGSDGIRSGGGECSGTSGTPATPDGSGTGSNNNGSGGNSSTGTGSCEGVSISCPAGWSNSGGVYCENGSNTCKLKCVKPGEGDWWHEGGSCSAGSTPPASSGTTPPPTSGDGGSDGGGTNYPTINEGEYCTAGETCICRGGLIGGGPLEGPTLCTTGSPPVQEGEEPEVLAPCSLNCSEAQTGAVNSYQCGQRAGPNVGQFEVKTCCNEGYAWSISDNSCERNATPVPVEVEPISGNSNVRPYEGSVWFSDDAGEAACNLNCEGTCSLVGFVRSPETVYRIGFSTSEEALAACERNAPQGYEGYSCGYEKTFNSAGVSTGYQYEMTVIKYATPSGERVAYPNGYVCSYESNALTPRAYALLDPKEAEVLFDPASKVYYVGEAGVYQLEYEGETYEAVIGEDLEEVILFVDQDGNGEFDDEIDTQIVEEPVELNIQQVSTAFDYELKAGFNFVHFPMIMGDYNTASALLTYINEQSNDAIYSIAKYDDTWKVVGNNGADYDTNDFQIVPGVGYLIRAKEDVTITLGGNQVIFESEEDSAPVFLSPGWNLMGIYGTKAKTYTAESLIDGINGFSEVDFSVNNVSSWSVAKGRYEGLQKDVVDAEESAVYGFDFPLNQKSSYFVRVSDGVGNWEPERE